MNLHTLEEGLRIALDAVRANKIRSGLTILGVAIGVSVVVAMASMITGIRGSIVSGIEAAGPRNFFVARFDFSDVRLVGGGDRPAWWDYPRLEAEEAERVAGLAAVDEALYNFSFSASLQFEGRDVRNVQSQGYSSGWPAYSQGEFEAGRDFLPEEVRSSRAVVVVSEALARELFGQRDPIGRWVRATAGQRAVSESFRVVGVYRAEENVFSDAVRHWAVFPYTTAMKRLKVSNWQAQMIVVPEDGVEQEVAIDQVVGAMRSMRGLRPGEENTFAVMRSAELLESFNQLTAVFFLVMLALSSVGLLVGGIGVIGIMMISVTERTREIGVRKSIGATRREILWQFLVEAAVLTLFGGALGLLLGWGLSSGVASMTPLPAEIPLWSVAAALAMAVVTGMLFGLIPAVRASRMEPVVALRAE